MRHDVKFLINLALAYGMIAAAGFTGAFLLARLDLLPASMGSAGVLFLIFSWLGAVELATSDWLRPQRMARADSASMAMAAHAAYRTALAAHRRRISVMAAGFGLAFHAAVETAAQSVARSAVTLPEPSFVQLAVQAGAFFLLCEVSLPRPAGGHRSGRA